jgi:uncharacterized membrane-anchored protein
MGQTGKTVVALVVSAVSGFRVGLAGYALNAATHPTPPWAHEADVALATRAGILFTVLVFFVTWRRIRSN